MQSQETPRARRVHGAQWLRELAATVLGGGGAMIRIDALWLCTQPQDMRAGADRLLAVVVNTVGQAQGKRPAIPY